MTEKGDKQLNIDTEFKNLIRPLRKEESMQLELNLVVGGCRDPIITWNVTIQSPTTNNRHTLQRRLNCKEGTYAVLESCTCI